MERRKAITAAAAVSLTLLAGAAGMALSSNLVGAGVNDDVGQLSPVSSATNPAVTVDDQSDLTSTLATAPPAQEYDDEYDDDEHDDDEYDDDEHDDDEHDDDEHEDHERAEYEGRDDDD
jgi:hypothetical protein